MTDHLRAPVRLARQRIAVVILSALAASCGGDPAQAFPDTPASPTPASADVFRLQVEPVAVMGEAMARGVVTLTLPAPAGGLNVTLSSDNPATVVPASIRVPAGATTGEFSISTRAVTVDVETTIRATAGNQSVGDTLEVWAVLPQFFSFVSEPGDFVGAGRAFRARPTSHAFRASCQDGTVSINVDGGGASWSLRFAAAPGQSLSGGVYEGAVSSNIIERTSPGMSITGNGSACSNRDLTGRFVVHEADLAPSGTVRRFWASFEQRCQVGAGALRGDVRVMDQPAPSEVGRPPCRR